MQEELRRVRRIVRLLAARRLRLRRAANAPRRREDVVATVTKHVFHSITATESSRAQPQLVSGLFNAGPFEGEFSLTHRLRDGSMASVASAVGRSSGASCALKFLGITADGRPSSQSRASALEEVRVHRAVTALASRHLVPLTAAHDGALSPRAGHVVIAMPIARRGDLCDHIIARGRFPEARALRMLAQLLGGLADLPAGGFIHRDVKTDNVLLAASEEADGRDEFLLSDFGFTLEARRLEGIRIPWKTHPNYAAPEIIDARAYSDKSDVYAAGAIFYNALSAGDLIPAKGADYAFLSSLGISDDTQALLRALLARNPDERPTARNALRGRFTPAADEIETDAE
jgi:serine/threonine protein kinase